MTVYLEQKNLKRKVLNMLPSAGLWEHQLWSVLEIRATETITKEEEAALIHMWEKQLTDFGDRCYLHRLADCVIRQFLKEPTKKPESDRKGN